jgi:colanic acid/amylovoran biosynthesis glycosyltransferase
VKLIYVLRYYPTLSETFVRAEVAELVDRGHQVRIVALGRRSDGGQVPVLEGVEIERPAAGLWLVCWMCLVLCMPWVWGEQVHVRRWKHRARAVELGWRVRRWRPDRVHVHFAGEAAEWACVMAEVACTPCSVTVHAVDLYKPRSSLGALLLRFDVVVTVSQANAVELLGRYGVRALVVRCGVHPERWDVARAKSTSSDLRVVSVGRWTEKKGFDVLLEAVRRTREPIHLRLVSEVPDSHRDDRVVSGYVPHRQLPDVLSEADVFVLSCRVAGDGDRDGIPVALMEAMASGLPVITSRLAGLTELVDDAVGWLVEPEDVSGLMRALDAARDAAQRERRGQAGVRRIVEGGWTVARQIDELVTAWRYVDS